MIREKTRKILRGKLEDEKKNIYIFLIQLFLFHVSVQKNLKFIDSTAPTVNT